MMCVYMGGGIPLQLTATPRPALLFLKSLATGDDWPRPEPHQPPGAGPAPALSSVGPAGRLRGRPWLTPAWRCRLSASQTAGSEGWAEPQGQVPVGKAGLAVPAARGEPSPLRVPRLQEPPSLLLDNTPPPPRTPSPKAPHECWRALRYIFRDRCLHPAHSAVSPHAPPAG